MILSSTRELLTDPDRYPSDALRLSEVSVSVVLGFDAEINSFHYASNEAVT